MSGISSVGSRSGAIVRQVSVADLAGAVGGGADLLAGLEGPAAVDAGDERAEVGNLNVHDGVGAEAFDVADAARPKARRRR